jgi:hypothetical protein
MIESVPSLLGGHRRFQFCIAFVCDLNVLNLNVLLRWLNCHGATNLTFAMFAIEMSSWVNRVEREFVLCPWHTSGDRGLDSQLRPGSLCHFVVETVGNDLASNTTSIALGPLWQGFVALGFLDFGGSGSLGKAAAEGNTDTAKREHNSSDEGTGNKHCGELL